MWPIQQPLLTGFQFYYFLIPHNRIFCLRVTQNYFMYQWMFRYTDCTGDNGVFSPRQVKCVLHLPIDFKNGNTKFENWIWSSIYSVLKYWRDHELFNFNFGDLFYCIFCNSASSSAVFIAKTGTNFSQFSNFWPSCQREWIGTCIREKWNSRSTQVFRSWLLVCTFQ